MIVHGWFKRLIYWPPAKGWEVVTVKVDGKSRATLDEVRRKPVWIPLQPGRHVIEFDGLDGPLRVEKVELGAQALLVSFRPPTWVPFKPALSAQWCVRALDHAGRDVTRDDRQA